MGISLKNLIEPKEIGLSDLKDKMVAIDSFNLLYQFLTTIRMADGSPLRDSKGNVTSHLQGLLLRTSKIMAEGIKPVFVFDGKPPELKMKERERRAKLKEQAEARYKEAKEARDIDSMKKYAGRTTKLTPEMIDEAKRLISLLGCPIVQAPSEGEAQAAAMVKSGDVYAAVSQDFDSLLFGSPRIVRNMSIVGKRKKSGVLGYSVVKPEIIMLSDVLNSTGIDQEMLIVAGMLIGTDYNYGGIKGIGPKNAIKKVREYGKDYDRLFEDVKWSDYFNFDWKEVFYTFINMKTTTDYDLKFCRVDYEGILEFLCDERDFTRPSVERALEKLKDNKEARKQKSLFDF